MSTDDKFLTILEKTTEISERLARIEVKTEVMSKDLEVIKIEDSRQNNLLDIHIQGTRANTARLNLEIDARKNLEVRINKLERFPNFMKSVSSVIMYLGGLIGIIYETGRIFKKW